MKAHIVVSTILLGATMLMCSSPPEDSKTLKAGGSAGPEPLTYRQNVDAVLSRRCASLDCHGQVGRPLRLYSNNGLRRPGDGGTAPGVGAVTTEEIADNYRALIGLEPEAMLALRAQAASQRDPYQLLMMRKALNVEGCHKGGPAIFRNDKADVCITSWLKKNDVDPLPAAAVAACSEAASSYLNKDQQQ